MYPRNAASPEPIAIGAVVQISDGAVQTSGCTVRIKPIGVAEGDGGGTTAYSTDGIVEYTPTQAETNYTSFILIGKKTGCIPVAITVVTSESATPGRVSVGNIIGTALTETSSGYLAAAFKKLFDVAAPVLTVASVNQTGDSFAKFTGMTNLAQWLGALMGKQAANSTAQTEIRATGAGSGTFDATTDSTEAVRDRGDSAWVTGAASLDAAGVRAAVGLATANLDTQLDALPTNTELATALGTADDAVLAAIAALNNLSSAGAQSAAAAALTAYGAALEATADGVKTNTDKMVFGVTNALNVNVTHINEVELVGDGSGTPMDAA